MSFKSVFTKLLTAAPVALALTSLSPAPVQALDNGVITSGSVTLAGISGCSMYVQADDADGANSIAIMTVAPLISSRPTVLNSWYQGNRDTFGAALTAANLSSHCGVTVTSVTLDGADPGSYAAEAFYGFDYVVGGVTYRFGYEDTSPGVPGGTGLVNSPLTPANNAPILGGTPSDDTATEDVATAIDLSAYNVSDADGDPLTLTLAVNRGVISATTGNGTSGGVTVAGSGSPSMTLQGAASALNTFLDDTSKIEFLTSTNDTASAVLTVTPNDGTEDGTPDTVGITILAVNDAPTDIGISTTTVNQSATGASVTIATLSFTDVDNASGGVFSLVSNGTAANGSCGVGKDADNASFEVQAGTANLRSTASLAAGTYDICVRVIDQTTFPQTFEKSFSITVQDNVAPTLTEVTPVTTPTTDTTPNYVFSTTEAGSLTLGGSCRSTASTASVGNNTITLDADGAGGALASATYSNCTVTVEDAAGNTSSALAITDFTVDAQAPTLNASAGNTSPLDNATAVGVNSAITLDFSEDVQLVSGQTITLADVTNSAVQEVFTASSATSGTGSSSGSIAVSGGDITITPGASLPAGTQFAVQFGGGAIRDVAGNTASAISDTTSYNFTTAPLITIGVSPAAIDEDGGVGTFTVSLVDANGAAFTATENVGITVNLSTNSATATSDYTLSGFTGTSDTVTISSGTSSKSFTATAVNDQPTADDNETLVATLASATSTGTAIVSGTNSATLTIEENYAPAVASVSVPSAGTAGLGTTLQFGVTFDQAVVVTGTTATLPLTIGSTARSATYAGTSGGGTEITFSYTVQAGDLDTDGITLGSAIVANTSTIRDSGGTDAVLTLNNVASTTAVLVDAVGPTVSSVAVPANATYASAANMDFVVTFNEAVTVTGSPQLSLTIGSTTRQATYLSGSTSTALTFRYVVQSGDLDTDGISLGSLALNGGTLRDAADNKASLTLSGIAPTGSVLVDAVGPTVASVAGPANNTYKVGDALSFTVTFSEAATLTTTSGAPTLQVNLTSGSVQAALASGNGTTTLGFSYTVQSGDVDADGVQIASLQGTGLAVADAAGNAGSTSFTASTLSSVLVDGVAPTVTSVSVPSAATYRAGQTLDFVINYSETVVIGGAGPSLALTIGSQSRSAAYVSHTGSAVTVRYTVQAGDLDSDGITVGTLTAGTGVVTDAAGNNAATALNSVGSTSAVLVDAVAPTVSSITAPDATFAGLGFTNADSVTFGVAFSEAVQGLSTADFAVNGTAGSVTSVSATSGTSVVVTVSLNGLASHNGVIGLNVASTPSATDAAGNTLSTTEPGTDQTYTIDNTAPAVQSIARSTPTAEVTRDDELVFLVTFNEPVSSVSTSSFAVNGGAGTVTGIVSTSNATALVTVKDNGLAAHDGVIGLNIASTPPTKDFAGNTLSTSEPATDQTYTLDNTAPSVTSIARATPSTEVTAADSLVFAVTLSEAVTSLATGDFAVNGAAGAVSNVAPTASPTVYNVTVSGGGLATFNGTIGLNIASSPTAADSAGNVLSTSEPTTDQTYTLDNTQPGVASIVRQTPSAERTNADSLTFRVTFSEAVSNVGTADFESTGISGATVGVAPVSTSVYDVTLSGAAIASGNGAAGLGFAAGQDIADSGGNVLSSTTPSGANQGYILDNTAPSVASIARLVAVGQTTNLDTLVFTVTFSEAMGNIVATDFTVNGAAGAVTGVQNVSLGTPGSTAATAEVLVSGNGLASFNGAVGLNVIANPTSTDAVQNSLQTGEPATDESYTVDNTAPQVSAITRQTPSTETTNADSLVFRVTFTESVQSLSTSAFTVNGTAGSVSNVSASTGTTVDVTVSGNGLASHNGVIGLNLASSQTATDAAGNALSTSEPTTDQTYTLDNVGPSVTAIARGTPAGAATNADSLVFAVTFSDPMGSISTADFAVNGGAGSVTGAALASTTTANVTVSGNGLASHNGVIGLDVAASPTGTDIAGNLLGTGDPATDETYSLDNVAPTVTLAAAAGPFSGPFAVTMTFSEAVVQDASTLVQIGNGSVTGSSTSDQITFNLTVTPNATGAVTVDLAANAVTDAAGNGNIVATQLSRQVDITAPTVTITAPSVTGGLVNAPFQAAFTFSEAVTGFALTDISVGNGAASALTGSGANYSATITPAGDGAVTIDVAGGAAQDSAGNDSGAATQFSVTNDATPPTVALTLPGGTIGRNFEVGMQFSEPVSLQLSDISVTNGTPSNLRAVAATSNSANGTMMAVSPNMTISQNWAVDVTVDNTAPAGTTVEITVANTSVSDAAGNTGTGTTSASGTLDLTGPVITLSSASTAVTTTFILNINANENLDPASLILTDLSVTNGTAANLTGSGAAYTAEITPITLGQPVEVTLAAGAVNDVAGNPSTAQSTFSVQAGSPATAFAEKQNEIIDTVQQEARRRLETEMSANADMLNRARDRFIDSINSGPQAFRDVPFDVSGTASLTFGEVLQTNGNFFAQRTIDGTVLRTAIGQFDVIKDEDAGWTASLSARISYEWSVSDATRLGYFYGGSFSQGDISGSFAGDSSSIGVVFGGYGLTRLSETLYGDAYAGLGYSRTKLTFADATLALDGDYGAMSYYAGFGVTGSFAFANGVELRPSIDVDFGRTEIGVVGFDTTAFGLTSVVNQDFGSVSVLELTLNPEVIIPLDNGQMPTDLRVAPKYICRMTRGRTDTDDCGAGLAVSLEARSDDNSLSYGFGVDFQDTGGTQKTSLQLFYERAF